VLVVNQLIHRVMVSGMLFWNELFVMIECIVVHTELVAWFCQRVLVISWCHGYVCIHACCLGYVGHMPFKGHCFLYI
jgi:hypothetical protein